MLSALTVTFPPEVSTSAPALMLKMASSATRVAVMFPVASMSFAASVSVTVMPPVVEISVTVLSSVSIPEAVSTSATLNPSASVNWIAPVEVSMATLSTSLASVKVTAPAAVIRRLVSFITDPAVCVTVPPVIRDVVVILVPGVIAAPPSSDRLPASVEPIRKALALLTKSSSASVSPRVPSASAAPSFTSWPAVVS